MRQEQSRSKTPAARILSLALALCMIAAFVPAITLTAGAAETTLIDALGATQLWTAASEETTYSNSSFDWDGWTLTNSNSNNFSVLLNTSSSAGNVVKFVSKWDGAWGAINVTLASSGFSIDSDSETLIIEWKADNEINGSSSGNTDTYYDFTFYDTTGDQIACLKLDKNYKAVTSSYQLGFPHVGRDCAMVITNDTAGGTHTVKYYLDNQVVTTEELDGVIDGFGSIVASNGEYTRQNNYIGFGDLTIAKISSDNVSNVTATYTVDSDTVETIEKLYNPTIDPTGATFDQYYYSADGSAITYSAAECQLTADEVISVTDVVENTDVNGLKKGNIYDIDGISYSIASDNIIPNGDFAHGLAAWYGADDNPADDLQWTLGTNSVTLGGVGTSQPGSLYRAWPIEAGKTYLYTYTTDTATTWHITSLQTSLYQDEDTSVTAGSGTVLVGKTNSGVAGSLGSDAVGTNEFVFTVEENSDYNYLQAWFRWSSATLTNFGLYEIARIPTTVTVNFLDSEGQTIQDPIELSDGLYVSSSYTYDYATAGTQIIKDSDENTYVLDLTNENMVLRITVLSATAEENVINLYYVKDEPTSADGITVTTRVGIEPVLDSTVTAKSDNATFTGLKVTWEDIDPDDYSYVNVFTVDGTLDDFPSVTVTATVNVVDKSEYLIAQYQFEQNGENSVNDEKYAATVGSEIEYQEGISGYAAYFPGNGGTKGTGETYSEYAITLGDELFADDAIQESKSVTITAFVKTEGIQTAYARIFDFGDTGNGTDLFYTTEAYNYNSMLQLQNCGTVSPAWNTAPANEWTHLAVTVEYVSDSEWTATVYANGEIAKTYAGADATGTFTSDFTEIGNNEAANYYIGASNWEDPLYVGWIDDFRVYSVALTPEEIADLGAIQTETISYTYEDATVYEKEVSGYNGQSITLDSVVFGTDDIPYANSQTEYVIGSGDTEIAVSVNLGVTLIDGAQIRVGGGVDADDKITTDSGIRFIAYTDTANTVAGLSSAVEGIAIFDGGVGATATLPTETTEVKAKVQASTYQGESSYFTVAITNIDAGNYNHIYVAVPYVEYNGKTYYNFDNCVARTPYEVAAGVLTSSTTDTTVDGNTYKYAADETALYKALNAYANMTGARIEFTDKTDYSKGVVYATYANSAKAFFEIVSAAWNDGGDTYTITLAPVGDETVFYEYATEQYRVNNSHTAFEENAKASAAIDETTGYLVITITGTTKAAQEATE